MRDVIVFGTWMPSTPWWESLPDLWRWHYCPDCQVQWTVPGLDAASACWNCEKPVMNPFSELEA